MRSQEAGSLLVLCALAAAGIFSAYAMAGHVPGQKEITVQEVQSQFKLQVQRNMVLVRVVVRDSKGNPAPNLRKEDFRLFDNGKLQEIEQFEVESAPSAKPVTPAPPGPPTKEAEAETPSAGGAEKGIARNYLAFYFDDVQMTVADIGYARNAADRYLAKTLAPEDRVGVFTTSGQGNLDFTDDREKLHEALFRLQPRARISAEMTQWLGVDIGEYQAYLIARQHDEIATEILIQEAKSRETGHCVKDIPPQELLGVQSALAGLWNQWETQSEGFLRGLNELIRRVSILPGRRNVVFLSPGFLFYDLEWQISQVTDRALRAGVIVNALDPRGLYTITPDGDAGHSASFIPCPDIMAKKDVLVQNGKSLDEQVLRWFAEDTGGQFFHNSNDLDQGFRQVGTLAEVYYVLAFSPHNLKFDGRFHNLKVKLVNPADFTLQARRGYFAPKTSEDAATRAKEEIQQAAFSQDDLKELPIDVHTQFYRLNDAEARLAVLTHLDMNSVRFRDEKDLHVNSLTFLTVVFDRDGKCVVAKNKRVDLKLRDATIAKLAKTGLTVKTEVDLQPGTYSLRQIVRDSEAGELSALSRTVEIPY